MRKFLIILLTHAVFVAFGASSARARSPAVMGVNVMGVQEMSEQQQDALIEKLRQNGVKTVRTGFGQKFNRFIIRAFESGIGAVAIVYPTEGATGPMRPAAPAVGLQWAVPISLICRSCQC
jgi:hypothetical protein